MTPPREAPWRLIQLCRVVERERKHLLDTTGRLFVVGFDQGRVAALEADPLWQTV